MPNPTRETTAGRMYNDLRNLARHSNAPTDQAMLEYLLERFLYRVSVHPLGGQDFVLKGGLLLAQFAAPHHADGEVFSGVRRSFRLSSTRRPFTVMTIATSTAPVALR
jgi:hypothetical protein